VPLLLLYERITTLQFDQPFVRLGEKNEGSSSSSLDLHHVVTMFIGKKKKRERALALLVDGSVALLLQTCFTVTILFGTFFSFDNALDA
jgi:hypothetical protein